LGRALAIELARYSIPLILVSRNEKELKLLSEDIERYYGVSCHVIVADLNNIEHAEKIYKQTKDSNLVVDILVYNAGICYRNHIIHTPSDDIQRMIRVNALSMALLTSKFGYDMKQRKRGRILLVSSIMGSVPSGPSVGIYAATKAFSTSLATSLRYELDPYGVAVTCLIPGAIKDTSFTTAALNQGNQDALCWKIPFYPKSSYDVAHRAIRSLLVLRGTRGVDVEVIPGFQNKFILNSQWYLSKHIVKYLSIYFKK